MRRYLIVGPVAWATLFAAFLYAYKSMWDLPWLTHMSLLVMMVIATTAMFGSIIVLAEVLAAFNRIPRWMRAGVGALVVGLAFTMVAFVFGTRPYSHYDWPGMSGIAIVLFQEYRMLLFATIPVPVACCLSIALVFWRSAHRRSEILK